MLAQPSCSYEALAPSLPIQGMVTVTAPSYFTLRDVRPTAWHITTIIQIKHTYTQKILVQRNKCCLSLRKNLFFELHYANYFGNNIRNEYK